MRIAPKLSVLFLAALFGFLTHSDGQTAATAPKRLITDKDLFGFEWIGDTQLSADGSRIAFVKVKINEKKTGYDTAIWLLDTKSPGSLPLPLTNGPNDGSPQWSHDGAILAFTRAIEKDGKPAPPQLYLLSLAGGEPRVVTDLPGGVSAPRFSPDGRHLLFDSGTSPDDIEKQERAKAGAKPEEHESDVHVITHAMYRMNGSGYIDVKHPSHLWSIDVPVAGAEVPKPLPLTKGRFSEGGAVWSADSQQVYFLTDRQDEPYYRSPQTELMRVSSKGGDPVPVASLPMAVSDLSLSPDGNRLAFHAAVSTPVRSYSQPDLWVLDLGGSAQPRNLTSQYDADMGSGVGGDNAAPRQHGSNVPVWTSDGNGLLDVSGKEGRANLVRVDVSSGTVTEWTRGQQAIELFKQSADRQHVVAVISTPTSLGDLYDVSPDGSQHLLTDVNAKLFGQLQMTLPDEIWFKSFDGRKIQTWVQKPPDFDPSKKYPLILDIHGGPHSAYGWVFDHEFQWMAAQGYVVVYPNPRGSTTYGQDFGNVIQYKYPGDDFRDLMLAVDEVVKRGYVDASRMGVTGGSGGGLLTDWVVTHSNRFKAAVSQRDVSDFTSWWYTADVLMFEPQWFKDPPFQIPADYANRSAITHVKNIRTPMMFILGDADYRTPPTGGGEELFRALKYMKEPTVMVRFPNESHELSRSGQPWHRVERLDHIVGWFDKYLKGEKRPEYDVVPDALPQPEPHEYKGEPAVQ